jgi:hypothetical protein
MKVIKRCPPHFRFDPESGLVADIARCQFVPYRLLADAAIGSLLDHLVGKSNH